MCGGGGGGSGGGGGGVFAATASLHLFRVFFNSCPIIYLFLFYFLSCCGFVLFKSLLWGP